MTQCPSEHFYQVHPHGTRTHTGPADLQDPNVLWTFCPSIGPADLMAILFGITLLAHIVQAIKYRKAYCWVIAMASVWQMVAYIGRIISIEMPTSIGPYAVWFVLLLVWRSDLDNENQD